LFISMWLMLLITAANYNKINIHNSGTSNSLAHAVLYDCCRPQRLGRPNITKQRALVQFTGPQWGVWGDFFKEGKFNCTQLSTSRATDIGAGQMDQLFILWTIRTITRLLVANHYFNHAACKQ